MKIEIWGEWWSARACRAFLADIHDIEIEDTGAGRFIVIAEARNGHGKFIQYVADRYKCSSRRVV